MKKNLLLLTFLLLIPFLLQAQVGIGTEDPHASAALEIESNEKGLLIPRLTFAQKNAIQNPAESLLIYQLDGDTGFYFYNGSSWTLLKHLVQKNADWASESGETQILNKPDFSDVALSGDFFDLNNIPEILFASDTSKMLLPFLTVSKIQPFLDSKVDLTAFENEIARAKAAEKANSDNITQNTGDIYSLNTSVVQNTTDIQTNSINISANTGDINSINTTVSNNSSDILTNATNIELKENSANKSTDVTLADETNTKFPTEKAVKTFVDVKVSELNTATGNVQSELDATQVGAGLESDGSYVSNIGTNFLTTSTSLKDATEKLDAQVKINEDNITLNTGDISTLNTTVSQNITDIQTNASGIQTNADNISANTGDINSLNTAVSNNSSGILTNAANIALKENSANKSTDVTLADETDTKFPTEKAVKTFVDGKVSELNTATGNVQSELDATQTGAGLELDGSYVANTATNFLNTSTSLKDATEKLDAQAKTNADAIISNTTNISANATDISTLEGKVITNTSDISTNATNIALKENSANKSADVTLADDTDTKFPTEKAVKTYVDGKEIDLETKATGILAITNGGTGSDVQNFVDLNTDQTIAGNKLMSSDIKVSGITVGVGGGDSVSASYNTALGLDALVNNTGWGNTAIGRETLTVNENSNNTAVGYRALKETLHGNSLVAVGSSALQSNTEGNINTALGASSLGNNTMGSENTAVGGNTLMANILGSRNTAIGRLADVSSSNLNNTTAIGYDAKVEASNTIQLGNSAITDVKTSGTLTAGQVRYPNAHGTSGQVLSTTGTGSLTWVTPSTATNATFVDLTSAQFITGVKTFRRRILFENESWGNKATMTIGFPRSGNNLSGLAIGINTLDKHQYGVHEIAIGNEALFNDLRGSYNIGIGYRALYNMTDVWGHDGHKWGNFNVGIGSNSGSKIIVGTHNTLIGSNSDTFADRINNATAIGNGAIVNASNTIQLGNGAITDVKTSGTLTAGNVTYPNIHGTNGQVLSTTGTGSLAWITPSTATSETFVDLTSNQTVGGNKTFTGTISGITSDMVGLGNVDNTTDLNKPISFATQISLDFKADLDSPTFNGVPLAPTASPGTNTTQLATTAFVTNAVISATASPNREVADEFTATASQTSFDLTQIPSSNSKVKMYVNGIRISNSAYSVSGTTLTYAPANNGGYSLATGDRIQMDFYY